MPLQQTSGAASYDAFGGGVAAVPKYIEDYFSTFLYSGTGSDQTITNNIDLSTKGGLVWLKKRTYPSGSVTSHYLMDTNRGTSAGYISSNSTDAENAFDIVSSFNTNGFGFNTPVNDSGDTYASWSWAKAPKFFDVVTYTGNGAASRNIAHNLGSVPGCIIGKTLSISENWGVYHRSTGANGLYLNATNSAGVTGVLTGQTSTTFEVGNGYGIDNSSGVTYVAYLFAHDAGGFGLNGTDNVISCGSVSATGSVLTAVNLGWEPQWVLIKRSNGLNGWSIVDNMRKFTANNGISYLSANTSSAEASTTTLPGLYLTSTGFSLDSDQSPLNGTGTYIYIAIRRGPMKVPTSGTSVFAPLTYTGNGTSGRYISGAGFPPDLIIQTARSASENREFDDRLRGGGSTAMNALFSNSTNAEAADSGSVQLLNQDGFTVRSFGNGSSVTYIGECFRRAPSFFDEVCYTGNGTAGRTLNHNLGVAPELMIIKRRSAASFNGWPVYVPTSTAPRTNVCFLNTTGAAADTSYFNSTAPTSTVFSVDDHQDVNASGNTYVAYLFSTCAGVSKCTSFTGTGTLQTIDCGFTAGSRFVLIKRTDSTGDWYVWDSSRGLSSSTDPYLLLNSTAAEVTSTNWVDTTSTGFQVTAASGNNVNINGASYIALAIA